MVVDTYASMQDAVDHARRLQAAFPYLSVYVERGDDGKWLVVAE